MTTCVRLVVTGRVQGVGFRVSCARQARALALVGSVRNLADGSVEVVAEGESTAVDEIIRWCHSGPPYAKVLNVESTPAPPVGTATFRIG